MSESPLPVLRLPRRWELLEQAAKDVDIDPKEFVEKVDDACKHIDSLLGTIRTGGAGQFEILYGLSGSGKTTFVSTLPKFFVGIDVLHFDGSKPLSHLIAEIKSKHTDAAKNRIFLIVRRDNPSPQDIQQAEVLFSELVDFFRTKEGQVLVLWTITDEKASIELANLAWSKGRDSVCSGKTKGRYIFKGLPKEKFPTIADNTTKSLTGDGLEAFGIDKEIRIDLTKDCETVSDYFLQVAQVADARREKTWSVLKERTRPRLWVVLPGDSVSAVEATVRSLTQGSRGRIDIDLMQEFIDTSGESTLYVKEWKDRRSSFPHLVRAIDLRLFSLPPNVSLAAVRAYGESSVKQLLRRPSTAKRTAHGTLRSTRLYKEIITELGEDAERYAGSRAVKSDTEDEYRRLQRQANKTDKPLNKALGSLIQNTLVDDGISALVVSEVKELGNSTLQPDIAIKLTDQDVICIEPTWRSSGKGIEGELENRQNTLAEAHIKQYIMNKALDYVIALGL